LQIVYYIGMHTRNNWMSKRIKTRVNYRHFFSDCVLISENSWLMGEEQKTSEITLLILPSRILELVEAMYKNRNNVGKWVRKKWCCVLVFAIPVLLLVLLLAVLLAIMVSASIPVSIGMDICMLIGKLCKWIKGKLCNSTSANRPEVSAYIVTCLYPTYKEQESNLNRLFNVLSIF
jgi:hypothetical protein